MSRRRNLRRALLSLAHTPADIEKTVRAARKALRHTIRHAMD